MKAFFQAHVEAFLAGALALIFVLCLTAYEQEHTARLLAEQTVKQSQGRVTDLEQQSKAVAQAGQQKIIVLQKQADAVKTPTQAIQAIPTVSDVPLNARAVPELPNVVQVDAVPLYQELNKCRQDGVSLGVCTERLNLQGQIVAEKDIQITALKKKPGFWKAVKRVAITAGIGAAVGYAAHR